MFFARCVILASLLSGLGPAADRAVGVGAGLRFEPGVETRLPLAFNGRFSPLPGLSLAGALSADLTRSPLPDRFGLEAGWQALPGFGLATGAVLRRWPAWRAGENLAFVSARASPLPVRYRTAAGRPRLDIEAGLAWRVPLLDSTGWRSPLAWTGPLAEWNLVYGLGWRVVDRPGFGLRVSTGNNELLAVRTPDLVGVRLEAERRFRPARASVPGWVGTAALAGEIKGFSSVLAAFGAIEFEVGVQREF